MSLFVLLFAGSIVFSLWDIPASYAEYAHLQFPAWSVWFNLVGKAIGLVALFTTRSRSVRDFAFAGFLIDLLLALCAHIAVPEIKWMLPAACLGLWWFAYATDRKVHPPRDSGPR